MSIYPTKGNIISHGRYPVNQLVPGQTIRFHRETVVSTIPFILQREISSAMADIR